MTTHKNIYIALAAAQMEMGTVVKGAVNPHFKSKYADLADVMQVALPALNKHGVAAWHSVVTADGQTQMRTTLSHGESDTHIACDVPLLVAKNDMQGMKSATTYAKRIGIESLTGIAPEDDDGNAAAKSAPSGQDRPATISAEQFLRLKAKVEEWGGDEAKFLAGYKAPSLDEFPLPRFAHALTALQSKIDAAAPPPVNGTPAIDDHIPY